MSRMTSFVQEHLERRQSTAYRFGIRAGRKVGRRRLKGSIGFDPRHFGPLTEPVGVFVLAFEEIQIHLGALVGYSQGGVGPDVSLHRLSKGKVGFHFGLRRALGTVIRVEHDDRTAYIIKWSYSHQDTIRNLCPTYGCHKAGIPRLQGFFAKSLFQFLPSFHHNRPCALF